MFGPGRERAFHDAAFVCSLNYLTAAANLRNVKKEFFANPYIEMVDRI